MVLCADSVVIVWDSELEGPAPPGGLTPMTVHDMSPAALTMPHHHPHLARSRFMITDILSGQSGPPSPGDAPRDLSLHSHSHCRDRDADLSDGTDHESGTDHDSGLPGDTGSICSNGE